MKELHTLGPKTTDSYQVAIHLLEYDDRYRHHQIKLHRSFEEIYAHLNDYSGEEILVPVAYNSITANESWSANNYRYWDRLKIIQTFHLSTMPMVLVENPSLFDNSAIIHAATAELLTEFEGKIKQRLHIDYVTSKSDALKKFMNNNYQYAIVSKNFLDSKENNYRIVKEFRPEMIWCVYHVKK